MRWSATLFYLSGAQLETLQASELILGSRADIRLLGDFALDTERLVLQSSGLTRATDSLGRIDLRSSGELVLRSTDQREPAVGLTSGRLELQAERIVLDTVLNGSEGNFVFDGFNRLELRARDEVVATAAQRLLASADLAVITPLLTVEQGASLTMGQQWRFPCRGCASSR